MHPSCSYRRSVIWRIQKDQMIYLPSNSYSRALRGDFRKLWKFFRDLSSSEAACGRCWLGRDRARRSREFGIPPRRQLPRLADRTGRIRLVLAVGTGGPTRILPQIGRKGRVPFLEFCRSEKAAAGHDLREKDIDSGRIPLWSVCRRKCASRNPVAGITMAAASDPYGRIPPRCFA